MKVLLVSSSSGSEGGGELFLLYLGRGLRGLGVKPVLWASNHGRMDALCDRFREVGEVVRFDYRNTYDRRFRGLSGKLAGEREIRRLAESFRSVGAEVLHLNKQNLEDGLELVRAAGESGLASLCTIHLTQTEAELGARFGRVRDWAARRVLERYRGVLVAVSEARCRALRSFVPGAKAAWIANGVRIPAQAGKSEPGQCLVVGVGRLMPQKRPERFLAAAAEIKQRRPEARFVWVGSGPLESRLKELAGEVGLKDCFEVTGWVESAEAWLERADLLLHPAAYEGLPFALLEAMAWGVPTAVSKEVAEELPGELRKSVWEWCDGDWGRLVTDPAGLRARGLAGREVVRLGYSEEAMARRYLELYRSLR